MMPKPTSSEADVIVIGAGLSGAAFVAHLLRDHPNLHGNVVVIEPAARLGAGLAYGTTDPAHRINVTAGRMSLFPDQLDHFTTWLAHRSEVARDPDAVTPDGRHHARRSLFGTYVDDAVRAQIAASSVIVDHRRERARSATPAPAGGWQVTLETGDIVSAPLLVLGVSHTAPDLPPFLDGVDADPRVIRDPWDRTALDGIGPDDAVLVVGTGLTGCDVIASLRIRGHRGSILAMSRRGLLPRPRTLLPVSASGDFTTAPENTALGLLRRVRRQVAQVAAVGAPWEGVVDAIRIQARTIWKALPILERRRVLRHLRPFWDVHRFQCAPQIEAVLADGHRSGWLTVTAATPVDAEANASAITVRFRRRGRSTIERAEVAAVVNCTGPGHRSVVSAHPLLRTLADAGAVRADPCRLGIDVDETSRVIAVDGRAWPSLFVVGPLARGTHGELMGLPQVTTQPREVAAMVAALIPA